MSNQSILRITRELGEIQRGPDLSLAVACRDIDVRSVRALIIGPPDTPYEFGFFEFHVRFGREYPTKAPHVNAITTNGGRTRFNPNIYAQGKVCLSILGTWRGESGEEWSSAQGLESILISIQSLMSPNPYENEPGFEDSKSDYDQKNVQAYAAKIRHETLRVSIIDRLEGYLGINRDKSQSVTVYDAEEDYQNTAVEAAFEPFRDLCKRRFMWYYDSYLQTMEQEHAKYKDGSKFEKMPFEGPSNTMEGSFNYGSLKKRLAEIREKLVDETQEWANEGKISIEKESGIASNLQRQFEQASEHFKHNDAVSLDLTLVDKNPFVWELILFGRPMTNLDGGMFRFKIYLSPRFPEVLPRVICETPLFHHRLSKHGVVCYESPKKDDIRSHIDAIVAAIEEESPAYDPRTLVNPEAAKLFWGTPEDKKLYNRKLRRSVQDSSEY
ncbi:UBC-like protein [Pseudovirgaria hyperparasitica]|uniref:Ubiquitin-conjugating enzyme E2 Z n=1 Tax=Pseudovirgaria hyperparasitica TaxID=470096 RepID=A0A6A6VZJ7_9PEZI|nr:UBC-like protein [Pseudovirgaria hyperparasitica]KAF2754231.1 UBC-like protein [Pseudovirgaria hyperparasitica]